MAKVITIAALSAAAIATPALLGAEAAPIQPAAQHGHIGTARTLREITLLRALPIRSMLRTDLRTALRERRERRQERAQRRAQAAAAEAAAASTAAPAPTYTAAPTAGVLSQSYVAGLLRQVGFPESAISTMLYIIGRESGFNPNAVNGGGPAVAGGSACGLTQIYECPGPGALDPVTNLRYAYMKYQASGFAPWSM